MADILAFPHEPRTRGSHQSKNAISGEIVFFPGVRYERLQRATAETAPKKRPRRRDRIKIND